MKKPFVFLWVVLAGILLFSWIYLPGLSRYQDLKTRQDGVDIQIKDLQGKLKDIHEERDLLKHDTGYLEKVIREELGLVKPGEIVYKFVEEKPVPPPSETTAAEGIVKAAVETKAAAPVLPVPAKKIEGKVPALIVPARLVETAKIVEKEKGTVEPAYPRKEIR